MQLARLMEPRRERSVYAKLRQMVRAIEIERQLSKDQILDLYLALAPFGGNLEGIRAASIAYFGKEPKRLSLAEAALLVALPQSPETRRLDRSSRSARTPRATACSIAWSRSIASRSTTTRRRPSRAGAAAAQADADPGAAFLRRQAIATVKDTPVIKLTLDAACRKRWKRWRATARLRRGRTFRSRSSRSTMRAATCWRGSARRIISTSAAPGRST
jgi:penicillin-binding protein 1C